MEDKDCQMWAENTSLRGEPLNPAGPATVKRPFPIGKLLMGLLALLVFLIFWASRRPR